MRDYEIVFIAHPDLEETALNEVADKVKGWITEAGGSITKSDFWGRRRLAYSIRKQKEGQYILLKVKMIPESLTTFERNMRFLEPVMRFVITQV